MVCRLLGSTIAEQSLSDDPRLDPSRSRGGIHELELAIDTMDAIFNDKREILPVNVPNVGGSLPGLPEQMVVEVPGLCGAAGIEPLPQPALPPQVRGLRGDARRIPAACGGGGVEWRPPTSDLGARQRTPWC